MAIFPNRYPVDWEAAADEMDVLVLERTPAAAAAEPTGGYLRPIQIRRLALNPDPAIVQCAYSGYCLPSLSVEIRCAPVLACSMQYGSASPSLAAALRPGSVSMRGPRAGMRCVPWMINVRQEQEDATVALLLANR